MGNTSSGLTKRRGVSYENAVRGISSRPVVEVSAGRHLHHVLAEQEPRITTDPSMYVSNSSIPSSVPFGSRDHLSQSQQEQLGGSVASDHASSFTFSNSPRAFHNTPLALGSSLAATTTTTTTRPCPLPPAANSDSLIRPVTAKITAATSEALIELDPEGVQVRSIVSLNFKSSNLHEIPPQLYIYTELRWLDISHNHVRQLPAEFCNLTRLHRLAIGSNELTSIPDQIGSLTELTWLDFTHNRVATLPDSFGNLSKLASLGASDCRLPSLPKCICRIKNLRKLGIFNNLITALPSEIGNLVNLTKLDLSGNALIRLPKEIGMLTALTWLNLGHNQLVELPEELGNLVSLQELGLAHNRLRTLPDLSRLQELTLFPVYNNELVQIDDWVGKLSALSKLDLSCNELTSLPDNIFDPPNLSFFNIRRNKIKRLPLPRAHHAKLTSIDIRDNLLQVVPWMLMGPATAELKVSLNPLDFYQHGAASKRRDTTTLLDMAAAVLLRSNDIDFLGELWTWTPVSIVDGLNERTRYCEHCREPYCGPITNHITYSTASDLTACPFLIRLCSAKCAAEIDSVHQHIMMHQQHHNQSSNNDGIVVEADAPAGRQQAAISQTSPDSAER